MIQVEKFFGRFIGVKQDGHPTGLESDAASRAAASDLINAALIVIRDLLEKEKGAHATYLPGLVWIEIFPKEAFNLARTEIDVEIEREKAGEGQRGGQEANGPAAQNAKEVTSCDRHGCFEFEGEILHSRHCETTAASVAEQLAQPGFL